MQVSFINVGYGDSILVEDYDGNEGFVALIDGGNPEEEHYKSSPYRIKAIDYLKEKNIEKIDLLVITHLHEDHAGGLLEVVKNLEVDELWCGYIFPQEFMDRKIEGCSDYGEGELKLINSLNTFTEICNLLLSRGKALKQIDRAKFNLKLSHRLALDVFVPREKTFSGFKELVNCIYNNQDKSAVKACLKRLDALVNNTSLVLRFIYGDKKVLLGADAYTTYWREILESSISIEADILKLPHHGHPDGTSEELLKAVNPSLIVISVSDDRTDNCPSPKVIEMIKNYGDKYNKGVEILFTDAVNMPGITAKDRYHRDLVFNL